MEEQSDIALIERWLGAGDELAARLLFERWHPYVQRFSLAWCGGNVDDAEDLSQDIFASAFASLGAYRGRSSFKTWLTALARGRALDRGRKRAREYKRMQRLAPEEWNELRSRQERSETEAARGIEAERTWALLSSLKPEDRTMLAMFETESYSIRELAGIFKMKEGTVKSKLSRARATLLKELDPELQYGS